MKKTIIIFIFGIVIGLAFIGSNLLSNHTISCGCYNKEQTSKASIKDLTN